MIIFIRRTDDPDRDSEEVDLPVQCSLPMLGERVSMDFDGEPFEGEVTRVDWELHRFRAVSPKISPLTPVLRPRIWLTP